MNDAVELGDSCLSNYAEWAITYEGAYYPTAEHLFQASRFRHCPDIVKKIMSAETGEIAEQIGSDNYSCCALGSREVLLTDLLFSVFSIKFQQYPFLLNILTDTNPRELQMTPDVMWSTGNFDNTFGTTLKVFRDRYIANYEIPPPVQRTKLGGGKAAREARPDPLAGPPSGCCVL